MAKRECSRGEVDGLSPKGRWLAVLLVSVALGKLGQVARREVETIDRLAELLRDPQLRVQMAVFEAAREVKDARLIEALEETPYLDGRLKRAAKETVRALREGDSQRTELTRLRDDLDKLKLESRGLKERLEALEPKKPAALKVRAAKRAVRKPKRR